MALTKNGEEILNNIVSKLREIAKPLASYSKEHDELIEMLKKHQEIIKKFIEIHI